MLTIDKLQQFGADTQEGLGRCMNNEGLYLKLVGMILGDAGFGKLKDALTAGDLQAAFEAAHALKGVLGNLSLTPLYKPASDLTELLRNPDPAQAEQYQKLCGEILHQIEILKTLDE